MLGYLTPARRSPMPEYTTWTMSQIASARRVIEALDRYVHQRASGIPIPPEPTARPGEVWSICDLDGVRHEIYMDEPTKHQAEQANFTPLPTVHELPEMDFGIHETHHMVAWKGFRKIHRKCQWCGAHTDSELTFECAFVR